MFWSNLPSFWAGSFQATYQLGFLTEFCDPTKQAVYQPRFLSNFRFLASCCATEFWRTMLAAGQIGSSSIWTGEMKQYLKPPP